LHTFTEKGGQETADEVNSAVLPWLENHGKEDNYFLHINYWDVHRNYRMPKEWALRFKNDPAPEWPDAEDIKGHQANYSPFSASELFPWANPTSPVETMPDAIRSVNDLKKLVDNYDGALLYMDHCIGGVLSVLNDLGIMDDTAIIISADHGEALGEHGIYADHPYAGEAVHRIPLIVSWPGGESSGKQVSGLIYNLDSAPTLCELLDLPIPEGWDGISFASAIKGENWEGRNYLVWDHALYSCQRAVRTREWLFIKTYHPGLYPFEPVMLYDMQNDPHQTKNLVNEYPEIVEKMGHLMMEWLHVNLVGHGAKSDPMQYAIESGPWNYVKLDFWLKRLKSEGRNDAVIDILNRLKLVNTIKL